MREIKFRAWIEHSCAKYMDYEPTLQANGILSSIYINEAINQSETKLMQYIGLKDKNGKEIYEGDIILFTNAINEAYDKTGVVEFDLDECGYKAMYRDDYATCCIYLINPQVFADRHTEITYEVIGNIYENPDLAKKVLQHG